jgi:hypothetical protein
MTVDRRQHERRPLQGSVQLVGPAGAVGAAVLDVSESGVRVRLGDAPGEWGEAVLLRRVGATEDGVRCHIVRLVPDFEGVQVGLRFDRSEADACQRLLALVS